MYLQCLNGCSYSVLNASLCLSLVLLKAKEDKSLKKPSGNTKIFSRLALSQWEHGMGRVWNSFLLQPFQVVSSRPTVGTCFTSQPPVCPYLVALHDPFSETDFLLMTFECTGTICVSLSIQSPRAGSWKARTSKPGSIYLNHPGETDHSYSTFKELIQSVAIMLMQLQTRTVCYGFTGQTSS